MAREATLSILGLYNWDETIFDLLEIPDGLDKQTCIDNILSRYAEMEILYPNPVIMKNLIGVWSRGQQYEWNTISKTMKLDYDPLTNYDRTETRILNSEGEGHSEDGGQDENSIDGSNTEKVNGFNASTDMVNRSNNKTDNISTMSYGKTNDETFSKYDNETIRAVGNIGIRSNQELIVQERDIAKCNLYDIIAEEFKYRFCILVY